LFRIMACNHYRQTAAFMIGVQSVTSVPQFSADP
jgi:hypothetical protein